MVKDYEKVISLLAKKMGLLQTKVNTHKYSNETEKVDDEIIIFELKWEIEAKKFYCKKFHERVKPVTTTTTNKNVSNNKKKK